MSERINSPGSIVTDAQSQTKPQLLLNFANGQQLGGSIMLPLVLSLAQWPFKLPARIVKPSDERENNFFLYYENFDKNNKCYKDGTCDKHDKYEKHDKCDKCDQVWQT